MSDVHLDIQQVDKIYGSGDAAVHAVKGLSMAVRKGEITSLLGSSGCGKTSTLRMIAGFESVSKGIIKLAGRELNNLAPVKRNVAMAFEGYSLYPPLTINDNIAFALKASKLNTKEIASKVSEVAEMLEITDILGRYPSSVSGGQQQRASLGRALVRDADLHLLDEPMGQLEPQLRALLRGRIKHYIKENGLTAILVTHDQAEANALSDRIAVMEGGYLQQFESPQKLKDHPANLFTGTFVGEPPMNVFEASVERDSNSVRFELDNDVCLTYDAADFSTNVIQAALSLKHVVIGVRPYAIKRTSNGIKASVVANHWLGDQSHIAATLAGQSVILVEHDRAPDKSGDEIYIKLDPDNIHLFDRESGAAISHGAELAQ